MSDVPFHKSTNLIEVYLKNAELWEITLVDTGESTMTAGPSNEWLLIIRAMDAWPL
jgi:hypothetical protein